MLVQGHTSSGAFVFVSPLFACERVDFIRLHPHRLRPCIILVMVFVPLALLGLRDDQHTSCLKQWALSTADPMTCTVCKTPFSATFIASLIGLERLMFLGSTDDANAERLLALDDSEWDVQNGVPALQIGESVWFRSLEHMTIYNEVDKRSVAAEKPQLRSLQRAEKWKQHQQPCANRPRIRSSSSRMRTSFRDRR